MFIISSTDELNFSIDRFSLNFVENYKIFFYLGMLCAMVPWQYDNDDVVLQLLRLSRGTFFFCLPFLLKSGASDLLAVITTIKA
jgi:hypothetical protein